MQKKTNHFYFLYLTILSLCITDDFAWTEEKDALTIYIRNVTESVTYEMLHEAFSKFGTIRTLNLVHQKACAFVEFAAPEAHRKALQATSVFVGDGHENVLTEKRVRKPPQAFTRRPSNNNLLKSFSSHNNLHSSYGLHSVSTAAAASVPNSTTATGTTVSSTATPPASPPTLENGQRVWLKKESERCDLTATC